MTNIDGFNKHTALIAKRVLTGKVHTIIGLHIETNGDVVSSHSIDFEAGADLHKIVGALETMKLRLMNQYGDVGLDDGDE